MKYGFSTELLAMVQTAFAGHVATIETAKLGNDEITRILWAKPGTGIYTMHILLFRGTLMILGDVGAATYEWSERITPQFLSDINFDYMMSKCLAAEDGREFKMWDSNAADAWLNQAEEDIRQNPDNYPDNALDEFLMTKSDMLSSTSSEQGWMVFCSHNQDSLANIWWDEWWELVGSPGKVWDPRAYYHWIGVQMACRSLSENPPTE